MDELKTKMAAIRERHAAATRGPWYWFGYLGNHDVSLHGRPGMASVMEFRRWGMQGAQPMFCTRGILQTVEEVAAPDTTPGRGRVTGINHPDALFIASAWQDVADLMAMVDRLEQGLAVAINAADPKTADALIRLLEESK